MIQTFPYFKRALLLLSLIFLSVMQVCAQQLSVGSLICEYKTNPLSISVQNPRLGWKLVSSGRNVMQAAYEVRVATSREDVLAGKNLIWKTGKVGSDQSVHVPYAGSMLKSGQTYFWQVRVWDNQKNTSAWSAVQFWGMGLLAPEDWKAKWITVADADSTRPSP
ncbi:MAG: alpha-L-rhamnosidase, partial [Mucilaginibacter polytrichastri]|nr:alpha-L-rhamnosidase [Mucilaginibacter polytrichastri]